MPEYQPLDIWQLDDSREIMISNAGSMPTHATLHLGEANEWDEAYDIAEPIAKRLGYRVVEHDISEDETEWEMLQGDIDDYGPLSSFYNPTDWQDGDNGD